jgi:hypothetical protein
MRNTKARVGGLSSSVEAGNAQPLLSISPHHYRVGPKRRSPSDGLTAARLMDTTQYAQYVKDQRGPQ